MDFQAASKDSDCGLLAAYYPTPQHNATASKSIMLSDTNRGEPVNDGKHDDDRRRD